MSEELVPNTRSDEEKRGITIGILIVALIGLSLFFVWRHSAVAITEPHPGVSTTQ